MKCDICGKEFGETERFDGLPCGIEAFMPDGKDYRVCTDCIITGKWKEVLNNDRLH